MGPRLKLASTLSLVMLTLSCGEWDGGSGGGCAYEASPEVCASQDVRGACESVPDSIEPAGSCHWTPLVTYHSVGACRSGRTVSGTCAFFPDEAGIETRTAGCDFDVWWRSDEDSLMLAGARQPFLPHWTGHCRDVDESEICECGCEAVARAVEAAEDAERAEDAEDAED